MTDIHDAGAPERRSRRAGGRDARRALRSTATKASAAFLTRKIKPYELVSDEGLELLEYNADTLLEQVGVEIRDYPAALAYFGNAGADVDGGGGVAEASRGLAGRFGGVIPRLVSGRGAKLRTPLSISMDVVAATGCPG